MRIDSLSFRQAKREDLEDIMSIEKDSFTDDWSYASLDSCLDNPFCGFMVAEDEGDERIVAYAIMMCMYEQGEIVRIAVDSNRQREGIAYKLVKKILRIAKHEGVESIFLDVRESNAPARALYEKAGFASYESTPDFYRNPPEASVKMRLNFAEDIDV